MKKLASSDPEEQKHGEILADEILGKRLEKDICEDTELKIRINRTVINKCSVNENSTQEQMCRGSK